MNVHEIDQAGRVRLGLCFAPKGFLVMGDAMLAQKIALETFGRRALAVANRCLIVDLQLRSNAGRRRLCVGRLAATSPRLEPPTYRHAFRVLAASSRDQLTDDRYGHAGWRVRPPLPGVERICADHPAKAAIGRIKILRAGARGHEPL